MLCACGCGQPVSARGRDDRRYVSARHRQRAYRARRDGSTLVTTLDALRSASAHTGPVELRVGARRLVLAPRELAALLDRLDRAEVP